MFDRFLVGLIVSLCVGSIAFIRSSFTKNYSFIDRTWSVVPIVYSWIFSDFQPRTMIMSLLITLWGLRLTLNFWRKGGYKAGEFDYRWPIVEKAIGNRFLWHLFNFGFISFYQSILLMLITVPTYVASLSNLPWGFKDTLGTVGILIFLLGETIADNQQWEFQTKKYEMLQNKKLNQLPYPYNLGFCSTGLFKYSRHPNFFCENMIWWTLTLFAFDSAKKNGLELFLFSGCFLLTFSIFIGSTALTESITAKKYPAYQKYQQNVSCLIPWFSRPMKE
jgi:steroid 5-alpha reductase family enzyme